VSEAPRSLSRRRPPWLAAIWLVPLLAAIGAAALLKSHLYGRGPVISVVFEDAEGLQPGKSDLVYKGATLGLVRATALTEDGLVVAEVQLEPSAEAFAREGARFWIVRPRFSGGQVSGLGTLVSGAYIAGMPGQGGPRTRFEALPAPPVTGAGGLEIVLISDKAGALSAGTPVLYRGVRVGAVARVALARDARSVVAEAVVERRYAVLVRKGSRFFRAGGIEMRFGPLRGAEVSAESLSAAVTGGVAFATPDPPGPRAVEGQGFMLAEKPEPAWLLWAPSLPVR
jgi:paraquat-inducible protein B